jgi:RimJ/RimL family protein N-acetyltransferase
MGSDPHWWSFCLVLSFYPEKGLQLFTIQLHIIVDGESIGHYLLVPHSEEMYEVHLSSLDKRYRRFASDISKAALQYVFNSMVKLRKLISTIPVHNRLAIKLANAVGMQKEGIIKNSFLLDGKMEDQELYGISKEDICQ